MNKIKILIIALSCIIVVLFVSILTIKFYNKENIGMEMEENLEIDKSLKRQQSPNIYLAVEKYLQTFFSELAKENNEQTYYLLHEDFINANEITIDNVLTKIIKISDFKNFDVNEMYVKEDENMYSNYVKGTLIYQEQKYIWYGLVETNNASYAIYPITEKDYNDIIQGAKIIERKTIKSNAYNEFFTTNYSRENLCYEYFEDYINKLLYNPDIAFDLLDDEYKNKRFDNNAELFKKYIEDKKKQLEESVMTEYSVTYDGYNVESINLKDNFNNYYIINENAVLDYTIQLDDYTIKSEEFYQEYAKLEDTQKVSNNLQEIVKMLNSKDYKNLYSKLYEQFKNNYFSDENAFKEYMVNTYYDYNKLGVSSITQENNIYICKTTLKDGVGSAAETKNFIVIMRLIDSNDYVLSFTVESE